jgi:uncharacterized membrane protein
VTFYFELLAILCCALFAGASLYISVVEHPARMECGAPIAATIFPPSYRRASKMQATLAVLGFVGGFEAWWFGAGVRWLLGAILLVVVVPFTLVAVMPTNARLLDAELDKQSPEAARLLARWGRLHAVRTVLSLAALLVFLFARG